MGKMKVCYHQKINEKWIKLHDCEEKEEPIIGSKIDNFWKIVDVVFVFNPETNNFDHCDVFVQA
jgi:hypothetical protein